MSRVCDLVPRVSFGRFFSIDLEYADDTILHSTSYSQLKDALGIYSEYAERLDLQVSWTKTKFMHVMDGLDPPPLRLGSDIVEPVKSFVYLGSIDKHQLCSLYGNHSGGTKPSQDVAPDLQLRCTLHPALF